MKLRYTIRLKEYTPTRDGAADVTVRDYGKMTLERAFDARVEETRKVDLNQYVIKIVDMKTGREF